MNGRNYRINKGFRGMNQGNGRNNLQIVFGKFRNSNEEILKKIPGFYKNLERN